MMAYIYRTIADSFVGVEIEYEYRNIDAVLVSRDDSDDVVVAIEHENVVQSIGQELNNLRELNCPLSVLVTSRST